MTDTLVVLASTSGSAPAELITWAVLSAIGIVSVRNNKDMRVLVFGLSFTALGVLLIRAIH
ncbi:MAG TPA: hypothetical protein ENG98_04035 [Actinobacteria bacterium]|nr:hypothetical protein BMS3Bbin02_01217 [bacterium BMS3Bbin02]HDL42162.1 hypothetical protein [Actinomycetota bacterium]